MEHPKPIAQRFCAQCLAPIHPDKVVVTISIKSPEGMDQVLTFGSPSCVAMWVSENMASGALTGDSEVTPSRAHAR